MKKTPQKQKEMCLFDLCFNSAKQAVLSTFDPTPVQIKNNSNKLNLARICF